MTPDPLREALERIAETHPSFCRCAAILTDDHDDRCPIAIARDALAASRPDPLTRGDWINLNARINEMRLDPPDDDYEAEESSP
jgi:hypothetical protein